MMFCAKRKGCQVSRSFISTIYRNNNYSKRAKCLILTVLIIANRNQSFALCN